MGWRFSRHINLLPGLRLNISKGGVSASAGTRGAWVTVARDRLRASLGLPGTGLSYNASTASTRRPWVLWALIGLAAVIAMARWLAS